MSELAHHEVVAIAREHVAHVDDGLMEGRDTVPAEEHLTAICEALVRSEDELRAAWAREDQVYAVLRWDATGVGESRIEAAERVVRRCRKAEAILRQARSRMTDHGARAYNLAIGFVRGDREYSAVHLRYVMELVCWLRGAIEKASDRWGPDTLQGEGE